MVGRLDWWNIPAEHTSYEWSLQIAMYEICPFGERRQDLRSGHHVSNLIAAQQMVTMAEDEFHDLKDLMCSYLPCDRDTEEAADLDALDRMKRDK